MNCVRILLFAFCFHAVRAESDNKLLQIFQSVVDDGVVSQSCQDSLALYMENINVTLSWAQYMLDATSKIPVGIFSLNMGEVGQFSQCLATESQDGFIKAKYCLGSIPLNALMGSDNSNDAKLLHQRVYHIRKTARTMTLRDIKTENSDFASESVGILWAICLPSNCKDSDVENIFKNVIITGQLVSCQVKEDLTPPLTGGAIATIAVLSVFTLLLVISTSLDLYFRFTRKESPHVILLAFSVYTNGEKLFRISQNSNEMSCLNGIRFLSMMWVIIGHVFLVNPPLILNFMDIIHWVDSLRSMTIVSGTFAVDTFLFLAGLLVVYSYIKAKHHGVKFNLFQFYIHRYLRLTPALAVLVLVAANLLKYMGSGPIWNTSIAHVEEACQENWWLTLLYVQNYFNMENFCLAHSWYLNVDTQLYAIAPLVLLPLWRYPKAGVCLIAACVVTFIIVPFVVAYVTDIPAIMTNFQTRVPIEKYANVYYIKTYTRAAPWFIGLFVGYVLAKIKLQGGYKHLTLNKVVVGGIWSACLAVLFTCVYGGHSTLMGRDYSVWASSFYIALVRPAWAICLGWIIFACEMGYGGPINWFLSFPIYQVLNRFTYSVYLVHYPLLTVLSSMAKTGFYFNELNLAYSFWGITMFSFGLALIWILAFESPVVVLEKAIFGSGTGRSKPQENKHMNDADPNNVETSANFSKLN